MSRGLAILMAVIFASSAYAAEEVPLPCDETPLPYCKVGLRKCVEVKSELNDLVANRVRKKVHGYYRGVDLDFEKSGDLADANLKGSRFDYPVCSILANEHNGERTEEAGPSHPGAGSDSCGLFTHIDIDADLSLSGDVSVDIVVDQSGNFGQLEAGWLMQGSKIAAYQCHKAKLLGEINEGKLKLTAETPDHLPVCAPLAADVRRLTARIRDLATTACPVVPNPMMISCNGVGEGTIRTNPAPNQEYCFQESARKALDSAFQHLVLCELGARVELGHYGAYGVLKVKDRILPKWEEIGLQCGDEAKSGCGLFDSLGACPTQKVNACYKPKVREMIRKDIEEWFPASGDCKASAGFGPLLAFGTIGARRRRRRRRHASASLAMASLFLALTSGCFSTSTQNSRKEPMCLSARTGKALMPRSGETEAALSARCCGSSANNNGVDCGGANFRSCIEVIDANDPAREGCPNHKPTDDVSPHIEGAARAVVLADAALDSLKGLHDQGSLPTPTPSPK